MMLTDMMFTLSFNLCKHDGVHPPHGFSALFNNELSP